MGKFQGGDLDRWIELAYVGAEDYWVCDRSYRLLDFQLILHENVACQRFVACHGLAVKSTSFNFWCV